MADQTATVAIELEDQVSGAAESAAGALKQLRDQIDADKRALTQMQAAMRNLQGGTVVNIQAVRSIHRGLAGRLSLSLRERPETLAVGPAYAQLFRQW